MSIEEVRSSLPAITVVFKGREYVGRVCGRIEPFAVIRVDEFPGVFEASWATVARVVSLGTALRID